jgi:hypothetical protein
MDSPGRRIRKSSNMNRDTGMYPIYGGLDADPAGSVFMSRDKFVRRLVEPPGGYQALFWAVLAVAVPTLVRLAIASHVTGVAIAPFVPFAMLAAIFLSWKHAAAVALVDALITDAFFIGPPLQLLEGPEDIIGTGFFLAGSAIIILFVQLMRTTIAANRKPQFQAKLSSGIVFSLERGEAWAGWQGKRSRVRLGAEDEVAEMMEDFLAQLELAERLRAHSP